MKRLAIIPARGGSKRFPGKNIALLNGTPLIHYTIKACAGSFDRVVFTSDSDTVLECAAPFSDVITIDKRPEELSSDTSKVIDTVVYYSEREGEGFDQIWLCLPTCPLRCKNDIVNAQELLDNETDSVVSITDFDFPPNLGLMYGDGNYLTGYDRSQPLATGNTRSQDQPRVYRPNGAVFGSWSKSFRKHKNFYRGRVKGYYMPRERSIDIDTELDLKIAEVIMNESIV